MNGEAAKVFANEWYEGGGENATYNIFWYNLLHDVFGIDKPLKIIEFQKPVVGKHIDAYISKTKTLIEHKSFGVDLTKKILQSDGTLLTPYEQAKRYADALPDDEKPRWIVTCNFSEFRIYSAKNLSETATTIIELRELRYQYKRLKFLVDPNADDSPPEEKISKDAIEIIINIYKAFETNYKKNHIDNYADDLNKICTRLVFCLYAGDADIFNANQFFSYLQSFDDAKRNDALQRLFDVLNTPENQRDDFDDALKSFPYVNGGLFDDKISLPAFNNKVGNPTAAIGVFNSRKKFRWHEISPPIFGAMFESTFSRDENKQQREGGMYYTSVDNIHKVINPLFMNDLREEFESIKRKQTRNRAAALLALQDKLSKLNFLDPACGSGNFLTETYLSLRRLENEILEELRKLIDLPDNPIKVSIAQFFGIEINSFAVAVAQTALWIAENQMLQETEGALGTNLQALPLKNYATIKKANALRIDWREVVTPSNVNYIIGNPPFIGARMKSAEQAADIQRVFNGWKNIGNLDYVACWYKKAADFIHGSDIRCAFVSTNSICQGDSVGTLWKNLFAAGVHIDFAHRTFKWLSDSDNMAHVHCVIVGFSSAPNPKPKLLFDGDKVTIAQNINAYLVDGEDIFVESRNKHLQDDVPAIGIGNKPIDGGNYLFTPEEMEDFIKLEPAAEKYFKLWFGAEEFIKGKRRYCLLLKDLPLDEIKKMPHCWQRVEAVRNYRLLSKSAGTRKIADKPTRFHVENFPHGNYIAIPEVSGESRQYIPIGFMNDSVVCSNKLKLIPNAELYHFGVLTSSIHMAWMRATNCPLGTSYSYSIAVVYNNFVWCNPTAEQKALIEESAQRILDIRKRYPDWTYAALYNEETMPAALRSAHKWNDYNVALAYGFENILNDEARIVAKLMKKYKALTS